MIFIQYNTWLFSTKSSNVGSANVPLLPNPTIALFRPLGVFGGCVCHCDQVQLCEFEWHIGRTLPKTGRPNQWCHTKRSLHMWFPKLFCRSLCYLFDESSSVRVNSISINCSTKIQIYVVGFCHSTKPREQTIVHSIGTSFTKISTAGDASVLIWKISSSFPVSFGLRLLQLHHNKDKL